MLGAFVNDLLHLIVPGILLTVSSIFRNDFHFLLKFNIFAFFDVSFLLLKHFAFFERGGGVKFKWQCNKKVKKTLLDWIQFILKSCNKRSDFFRMGEKNGG